jgi:hypothetical protein
MSCPTCGSEYRGSKSLLSAWDAAVKLPKNFKRGKEAECVVDSKLWYCGYCPDAWHDGKDNGGKRSRRLAKEK